ncbi:MAG: hypothetical protein Q9211_000444 [Gyalolechia sp. 1 TL-2023]
MALILANAAPLKPEVELAQALDDYGKILSDEEWKQLYAAGRPDAMAAINLTTLIDRDCSDHRRQCMGPRLITFLESVQQFSAVVDTFVSSHPEFAALVWGGVANNSLSYFGRLSLLLMDLGKQCPRISTLSALYPSDGLQKALCDYYAAIIRLCKHITLYLRKPAYTRLLPVSYEQEFGSFEKEIRKSSEETHAEVSLASMQAQKQESELQAQDRSEARNHRKILGKLSKSFHQSNAEGKAIRLEVDRRKSRKRKLQALDSLSTYDYQSTYKQIRKECVPGTSTWILQDAQFKAWKEGTQKGLWCSGNDFKQGSPIEDFLETALNNTRQYFIILDGLDECNEAHIREVSENLHSLLSSSRLDVKLFWCSRPNIPDWIPSKLQSELHINLENVQSQSHVASDIEKFIKITIEELLEGDTPRLRIGDPTLALVIEDRLKKEAHGMFLWVKLQLESLCQKKSDRQIIDTLNHLPRDLPETFERILAIFTEPDDIALGKQIFRWLAVAKRPLTVHELREAIAIEPLQDVWKPECLVNDMNKALACCGNLVIVEEEQQTVHFTHSSVRQYLCSDVANKPQSRYHVDLDAADADAGAICVTYLNLPIFNKQIARRPKSDLNTPTITLTIVKNTLPAGFHTNKIALRLLRRQDKSSKSVQRLLQDTAGNDEFTRQVAMLESHSFLSYAQEFWLEHTKRRISDYPGNLWRLWCNLLESSRWRDTLARYPWTFEEWEEGSRFVMEWVAKNNHCSLAQLLFDSEKALTKENLRILVEDAAKKGCKELIEVGVLSGKVPSTVIHSTLQSAAGRGHLAVVERLLQAKDVDGSGALSAAAGNGHLAVVEKLLQEKADVNAAPAADGRTALQAAAEGGHQAVVERLLREKADVHAAPARFGGRTALQAAAEGGHQAVVERLLQAEADVNTPGLHGRTALQTAAGEGNQAVVERLLQAKADVNASDNQGTTALHTAAGGGNQAVVERLLQAKVNINTPNKYGTTALHTAAEGGHQAVVDELLQANADVNTRDKGSKTALQVAAERGHQAVVERLLQAKADVNTRDNYGRTALQVAAGRGHQAVVEKLRAAGAK